MKKLIIAIDLDTVILDTNCIQRYAFAYHNIPYYDSVDWAQSNYPEEVRRTIDEMYKDKNLMTKFLPFKEDLQAINDLLVYWKLEGHTLFCVTAREKLHSEKTAEYILSRLPHITSIKFTEGCKNKMEVFKDLKVDLVIDDSPVVVSDCIKNKIPVILISDDHTLYSHHLRDTTKTCKSILEINPNIDYCVAKDYLDFNFKVETNSPKQDLKS